MSMDEFMPLKVEVYGQKGQNDSPSFDEMVLADITDDDDEGTGTIQIGFTVKSNRYFISFRKLDLRNALAVAVSTSKVEPT